MFIVLTEKFLSFFPVIKATSTGQDVLNVVYQHLGSTLLETAYFGLRFVDATHQPVYKLLVCYCIVHATLARL